MEDETDNRMNEVVAAAITQMKCMVLRAKHMGEDLDILKLHPTPEGIEEFCRKYDYGQTRLSH